jgi:hypothetical protein
LAGTVARAWVRAGVPPEAAKETVRCVPPRNSAVGPEPPPLGRRRKMIHPHPVRIRQRPAPGLLQRRLPCSLRGLRRKSRRGLFRECRQLRVFLWGTGGEGRHRRDRGHDRPGNVGDGRGRMRNETALRPVWNLDLTSCSTARLPVIEANANKTQLRIAHRSFADEERGLARTSSKSGRITSSATRA